MWLAATGRMAIVRMAEIVVGAADGRAAEGAIVDAAGAVEGRAAADGIAVVAAGREGEGTRNVFHGFTRI